MVTKDQALTEYNNQNRTSYATVAALGAALAREALKAAWIAKKRNDAHEQASIDVGAF